MTQLELTASPNGRSAQARARGTESSQTSAGADDRIPEEQPLLEPGDHSDDEAANGGDEDEDGSEDGGVEESRRRLEEDPRFNPPPPSPLKRLALIAFMLFLFYLAFTLRSSLYGKKKPEVIYASRYSREHKFRPAASPIITETLKDGRVRIRGAAPTATPEPKPLPKPKKTRSKKKGRRSTRSTGSRK